MQPGQANEFTQEQVNMDGTAAADRYLAYGTLYDLLSEAFTYPSTEFYAALLSKDFPARLSDALGALPETPALSAAHTALRAAMETISDCPQLQLESDYIALFDASRELPVIHPYARLYGEQIVNPAILLQQLQAIYREQGLVLGDDHGAEQADHITVQLEFMALQFRRLAQTPDDAATQEDARAFLSQLAWLPRFVVALDERGTSHWLYHPLAHLLAALYAGDPWAMGA